MNDENGAGTQIPLTFNKYEQIDFALYEAGRNHLALQHLQNIIGSNERKNVYLWGQGGTGKSHLLQALCSEAAKSELKIAYIPLADAKRLSPEMLKGLEYLELICLDDIDAIAGNSEWELAIFHLYNQLRDAQTPLLITAQHSPKGIPIQLPDLKSRLAWDHVYHLLPLDENTSLKALQKRAQSRGFDLPNEVAEYLLKRVSRDMHNLFHLLDKLDKASLIAKKKLTIPFVKVLLD
ncbi:MAG: DnaA family protein [Gammaproteobacteria bacterium]|jgi:DnaA family protein